VISSRSSLIGRRIRDADFRSLHDAAVVAVQRHGERIRGRIGDIELRAGDTLLLRTGPHFLRAHREGMEFFLVSEVPESAPLRRRRAPYANAILGLVILALALALPEAMQPLVILAVVYLVTVAFTAILTNNAAAALMFVVALDASRALSIDPRPAAILVALAAPAGFATPMSYQTNLMVYGPGGYRFLDFVRVGLPLNALLFVVSMALIVWWF